MVEVKEESKSVLSKTSKTFYTLTQKRLGNHKHQFIVVLHKRTLST